MQREEEAPAVKALVFHFLHSLTVRRMPLAKNASWKLVTSMYYLSVDGNLSLANKTHVRHDTRQRKCLNSICKRFFKELSSTRFFSMVRSFSKSTGPSFSVKISWHYYQLSLMRAGTVFTSITIISAYLQSTIQDQTAEVTYMGISVCVFWKKNCTFKKK